MDVPADGSDAAPSTKKPSTQSVAGTSADRCSLDFSGDIAASERAYGRS